MTLNLWHNMITIVLLSLVLFKGVPPAHIHHDYIHRDELCPVRQLPPARFACRSVRANNPSLGCASGPWLAPDHCAEGRRRLNNVDEIDQEGRRGAAARCATERGHGKATEATHRAAQQHCLRHLAHTAKDG